jgi:hypothetical protein
MADGDGEVGSLELEGAVMCLDVDAGEVASKV